MPQNTVTRLSSSGKYDMSRRLRQSQSTSSNPYTLQLGFDRIPLELHEHILTFIVDLDDSRLLARCHPADKIRRRDAMRSLSGFSVANVYCARLIRPVMFQTLILRSAKDLYQLLSFLRTPFPNTRIPRIGDCLRTLMVCYRLTDYFWCHSLQRLRASGVYHALKLHVYISGPAPTKCAGAGNLRRLSALHPLYRTIPRSIPFYHGAPFDGHLFLEDIIFADEAGLFNLVQDIIHSHLLPISVYCSRLVWKGEQTRRVTPHLPKYLSVAQEDGLLHPNIIAQDCTDESVTIRAVYPCFLDCTWKLGAAMRWSHSYFVRAVDLWFAELPHLLSDSFTAVRLLHRFYPSRRRREATMEHDNSVVSNVVKYPCEGDLCAIFSNRMHPSRTGRNFGEIQIGCNTHIEFDDEGKAEVGCYSIQIGPYYSNSLKEGYRLSGIIKKALGTFPRLACVEIYAVPQKSLERLAKSERGILSELHSRGMLRLYFSNTGNAPLYQRQHWKAVDALKTSSLLSRPSDDGQRHGQLRPQIDPLFLWRQDARCLPADCDRTEMQD